MPPPILFPNSNPVADYKSPAKNLQGELSRAIEILGKFSDALDNHIARIFPAVFTINFGHVFLVAVAEDETPVVAQAALVLRLRKMVRLNHALV